MAVSKQIPVHTQFDHELISSLINSELEDKQVAPPTSSLFWRQTLSFVLTNAFLH